AAASSTINADYNLIFGTSIPYSGASAGASDLFDDPLFADPKRRDFRLTPTSPAVDSAANPGIGDDFAKTPRPQGNGYDRGAFELIPVDEAISGLGVIHDGPTPLGSATR